MRWRVKSSPHPGGVLINTLSLSLEIVLPRELAPEIDREAARFPTAEEHEDRPAVSEHGESRPLSLNAHAFFRWVPKLHPERAG